MRTSPHKNRPVRKLILGVLITIGALGSTVMPAGADAIGGGGGGGAYGGGTVTTPGGGGGGGGPLSCGSNGDGVSSDGLMMEWFQRCADGSYSWGPAPGYPSNSLCDVAVEVWRFYGTKATPVAGWSLSRVRPGHLCKADNRYAFFAPHSHDALPVTGGTPVQVFGQPFNNAGGPWRQAYGRPTDAGGRWLFAADTTKDSLVWWSTEPPAYYGGVNCTQLETGDIMKPFMPGGAQAGSDNAKKIQDLVKSFRDQVHNRWGSSGTIGLGATNFYTGSSYGDKAKFGVENHCSSDLDFWTQTTPEALASDANARVYGVCYIPVVKPVRNFKHGAGAGTDEYYWAELSNTGGVAGKINNEYYMDPKTLGNAAYAGDYRHAIRNEVLGRTNGQAQQHRQPGAAAKPIPGNPTNPGTSPAAWRTNGAEYAAVTAACYNGSGVLAPVSEVIEPTVPKIKVGITLGGDKIAQVGGSIGCNDGTSSCRQFVIEARTQNPIPCDAAPCQSTSPPVGQPGSYRVNLIDAKFKASLKLIAPSGYIECKTSGQSNCDFRIVKQVQGPNRGDVTAYVEFYRATPPGGKYKVKYEAEAHYHEQRWVGYRDGIAACGTGISGSGDCGDRSTLEVRKEVREYVSNPEQATNVEFDVIGSAIG